MTRNDEDAAPTAAERIRLAARQLREEPPAATLGAAPAPGHEPPGQEPSGWGQYAAAPTYPPGPPPGYDNVAPPQPQSPGYGYGAPPPAQGYGYGASPPPQAYGYGPPPPQAYGYGPAPGQTAYPPPPGYGPGYWYPPPPASARGRSFSIAGLVCGILALLLLPIILGPLGAVFGFIGNSKGDRMGLWVGIGSIVSTVLGMILAAVILAAAGDNGLLRP